MVPRLERTENAVDTDPKAGTAEPDPSVSDDAGTDGSDAGSEAGEGKPVDFKLAMTWKEKAEKVNEAERARTEAERRSSELEEQLRTRGESPTADAQSTQAEQAAKAAEAEYIQLYATAQQDDFAGLVARRELRRTEQEARQAREMADSLYLVSATVVGDDGEERQLTPKEKQELRQFHKENKTHFASLAAAHDAYLGRKYRESAINLRKKEREAAQEVERKKQGIAGSSERVVSAKEVRQRTMTEVAFNAKVKELEEAGDEGAVFQLIRDRRAGKIVVPG
jgi:hypothetical protein